MKLKKRKNPPNPRNVILPAEEDQVVILPPEERGGGILCPQEGHLEQSLCPVGGFRLADRSWRLFSKFIIQLAPGAALQGSHSLCLSVCWQGKILKLLLLLLEHTVNRQRTSNDVDDGAEEEVGEDDCGEGPSGEGDEW